MKIRLKKSLASPRKAYRAGDVVEWDDEDALRLIDAGKAESVAPESAAKKPPKKAATKPAGEARSVDQSSDTTDS